MTRAELLREGREKKIENSNAAPFYLFFFKAEESECGPYALNNEKRRTFLFEGKEREQFLKNFCVFEKVAAFRG